MRSAIRGRVQRAVAAAATLTGKRFGLLVASSLVATSAIVASALTGAGGSGALAALLGRNLAAQSAPTPAPAPEPAGAGERSVPPHGGSPAPAPEPSSAPLPAAAPAPVPVSEPAPEEATPAAEEAVPEAGRVKHVFVISLTSPGYEQSLGAQSQMPYLSATLRPQGELLSNYTLLDPGALPNGIAAVSGQPPNPATSAGCPGYEEFSAAKANGSGVLSGSGCVYPVETLTLADQLGLAKFSWRAYAAGMSDATGKPASCIHPEPEAPSAAVAPGGYAASQNPFVYFHSLLDLGDCAANDIPIGRLAKDLGKAAGTPNYSFIAPTPCESGTTGQCQLGVAEGPAAADAFLSTWVPKILASPAYKADGLLIVAFSAAESMSPETAPGDVDLRTGALLLSPFLTPGATDGSPYDPYSLLRSSEDLFGLTPLARAGGKTRSFAPSLLGENRGD
jgi:phosphatidylinositol-3-phosphatase